MNKERRTRISWVINNLETCKDSLENVRDSEQESFDNIPESLQDSDRGQAMETNIEIFDEVIGNLDEMIEMLSEI